MPGPVQEARVCWLACRTFSPFLLDLLALADGEHAPDVGGQKKGVYESERDEKYV